MYCRTLEPFFEECQFQWLRDPINSGSNKIHPVIRGRQFRRKFIEKRLGLYLGEGARDIVFDRAVQT